MSHCRRSVLGLSARHGFTLIELLVVVAIIALLISILLPSLASARNTARMVKCLSILKQFGNTQMMYADENESRYAPSNTNTANEKFRWHRNFGFRQIIGWPLGNNNPGGPNTAPEGFLCPSSPDVERDANHIYHIYGANRVSTPVQAPSSAFNSIMRNRVVNPSSKVQFIDSTEYFAGDAKANFRIHWDVYGDASNHPGQGGEDMVAYRHMEGAAATFFDGHGEHRTKEEFYPSPGPVNPAVKSVWYIYQ